MPLLIMEIGTEEMPAGFQPKEEEALAAGFVEEMEKSGLSHGSVKTFSTPRRLVLEVENIQPFQKEWEEEIVGPAVKAAWNKDGKPTKALAGFCRGHNITPENITVVKTPKGEYTAIKRKAGGKPAKEILEQILPELISRLPFAKKMRWNDHNLAYGRPIRWILAFLGDERLCFSLEHLKADNRTFGHRVHAPAPIELKNAEEYTQAIREKGKIILDNEERKNLVRKRGDELAAEKNGVIVWRDGLLEEVARLVEYPYPIIGEFAKEYLEIPEEVLLTSMEKHQKSFGLKDASGKLLPYFLTVANIAPKDDDIVRHGWERVLKARLEDAAFFWREDKKSGIKTWLPKLGRVIFIGGLGNMEEKSQRDARLAQWLAEKTDLANAEQARRAGELSKADLVSGMVGEFDTLQGIMGGIYAALEKEPWEICKAIQEQYLPAGPDTPVPSTPLGAILAIADRADTLAGCFGLGRIPTGAADPDGLRRAALGIIRITLDWNITLPWEEIFTKALELYGKKDWKFERQAIIQKLSDFMTGRLRNWFIQNGCNNLVVDAVLDQPFDSAVEAQKRIQALEEFYASGKAAEIAAIYKRLENMVKKSATSATSWNSSILTEQAEIDLAKILSEKLPIMDNDLVKGEYQKALEKANSLKNPLNNFFDSVMILCEDKEARENRLALVNSVLSRLRKIATFGKLQI